MLRDFKYFFLLSRPLNVGISMLAFFLACLVANDHALYFVKDLGFWLGSLVIGGIAAAGYWINDVFDFRIDRINKPSRTIVNALLSVKKVVTVYIVVNVGLLALSAWFMGFGFHQFEFTFINLFSVILLFWYASYLKRVGLPGNMAIALLVALVIILAGYLYRINMALVWMVMFAFEITLIREIIKDIEDIRGDLRFNLQTLPIQIGIRQTKWVVSVLFFLFLLSCYLPAIYRMATAGEFLWQYLWISMGLVQAPSLFLMNMLARATSASDFGVLSKNLKYLMISGMATILFL